MTIKRKTTEEFIQQCKSTHGEQYDYTQIKYISHSDKVTIGCPKHGNFIQKPTHHVRGQGCPKCAYETSSRNKLNSSDEVINKFKQTHGERYNYSKMEYRRIDKKIIIICKIHGEFTQRPRDHSRGSGCPQCWVLPHKLLESEFINRAKSIYNDQYEYHTLNYKNYTTKCNITCRIHEKFSILPNNFLKGHGCTKCGRIDAANKTKSTTEEFIKRAIIIHKDKFNYDMVDYINGREYVQIKCNSCKQIFNQRPSNHLNGQGCPNCKSCGCYTEHYFYTNPSTKSIPAILYLVELCNSTENFYKIGITKHNLKRRFRGVNKDYEIKPILSISMHLYAAFCIEQKILKFCSHISQYRPLRKFGGAKECFTLKSTLIPVIEDIYKYQNSVS